MPQKQLTLTPTIRRIHSDSCIIRKSDVLRTKFCLTCAWFAKQENLNPKFTPPAETRNPPSISNKKPDTYPKSENDDITISEHAPSISTMLTDLNQIGFGIEDDDYGIIIYQGSFPWDPYGRIGKPRERHALMSAAGIEEVPEMDISENDTPILLQRDNYWLERNWTAIRAMWQYYKTRQNEDKRPHSWILHLYYFTNPELIIRYYDWLRRQGIDVPQRKLVRHGDHHSHLQPIPGDNVCLCYCCGPNYCNWTEGDHLEPFTFDEETRARITTRENQLRQEWQANYEQEAESRRAYIQANVTPNLDAIYDSDNSSISSTSVEILL